MAKRGAAWLVHGRVQGVGYRYFVVRWANHLGLAGWTRNLWDGTVEVQAFGEGQSIRQFESALKEGPSHARVDRLEPLPPSPSLDKAKSFTIEF
jgi:acylphosphatase